MLTQSWTEQNASLFRTYSYVRGCSKTANSWKAQAGQSDYKALPRWACEFLSSIEIKATSRQPEQISSEQTWSSSECNCCFVNDLHLCSRTT